MDVGNDFTESRLSPKQKKKVIAFFKQFSHVFRKIYSDFGLTDLIEHRIDLNKKNLPLGTPIELFLIICLKNSKELLKLCWIRES